MQLSESCHHVDETRVQCSDSPSLSNGAEDGNDGPTSSSPSSLLWPLSSQVHEDMLGGNVIAENVPPIIVPVLLDPTLEGKSSVFRVTLNFANAIVGAGIVGLPFAIHQAGLVTGLFLVGLVGYLSAYSACLLVDTGVSEGVRNYEELMDTLFGATGYFSVLLAMGLFDFGAMTTYLILLGDVSSDVMYQIGTSVIDEPWDCFEDSWCLRRWCILISSICFILPLCLFRDLAHLESASFISVVAVIGVMIVVLYAAIAGDNCPDRKINPTSCPDPTRPWLTFWGENPSKAFGILAFTFICHDSSFFLFATLQKPSKERWRLVTMLSVSSSGVICLVLAVSGYLAFREKTSADILTNFAKNDPLIIAVRVLYMFTMCFTYPISFFICRHIINELLYRIENRRIPRRPGMPSGPSIPNVLLRRHLVLTLGLFFSSLTVVMFVDRPGLVMSLTGTVCAVCVAFIFPPMCAIRSRLNRRKVNASALEPDDSTSLLHSSSSSTDANVAISQQPQDRDGQDEDSDLVRPMLLLIFGCFTMVTCTTQTLLD